MDPRPLVIFMALLALLVPGAAAAATSPSLSQSAPWLKASSHHPSPSPSPAQPTTTTAPSTSTHSSLPKTGFSLAALLTVAVLVALPGVLLRYRRRSGHRLRT